MNVRATLKPLSLAGIAGAGFLAWQAVGSYLTLDPFASMRRSQPITMADVGIQLDDVEMRQYQGEKLLGRLDVQRIEIRRDRAFYDLVGIRNGKAYRDGGFEFAAERGVYNASQRYLEVGGSANIRGRDFDLRTSQLRFDERRGLLRIPAGFEGEMGGGRLTATQFEYRTADGSFESGPWTWVGEASGLAQEAGASGQTRWTIKAKRTRGTGSKTNLNTHLEAEATDGEIIIKASVIEHNTKTDVLTATGNVLYFSPSANLTADKVVVYRKEKRAVLTGNVRMLVKPEADRDKPAKVEEIPPFRPVVPDDVKAARPAPKPDEKQKEQDEQVRQPKTIRDFPLVVSAAAIDYTYAKGKRRAIVTGSPQARQELSEGRWRHLWAFRADYDVETEKLRVESAEGKRDARMKNSIGDDLLAKWFEVSTKEDDDSYDAEEVSGVFVTDEDEVPRDEPRRTTPPPRTPPPGGGGGLRGRIGAS